MAPERPPADITPDDFFQSWIPTQFAKAREGASAELPDVSARFVLEGDGGGAWTLSIRGSQLETSAGGEGDADVVVSQSVADWRAVLGEDVQMPGGGKGGAGGLLANPTAMQTLRDLSGTIQFSISDLPQGTWGIGVAFKGAAEPNATITVDADTLHQMRDGTLQPTQAFFGGKITIGGDSAFAMQVGMALMAAMS